MPAAKSMSKRSHDGCLEGSKLLSIYEFNSRHVWCTLSAIMIVYSDVSSTGFSSYVVQHGEHIAQEQWSLQETQKSSTWRVLREVSHTLTFLQACCLTIG